MKIGRTWVGLALSACMAGGAAQAQAQAQDPDAARGEALYEARCGGCHDRSVHARASRTARSYAGIRAQVERWDRNLGALWRADEIDAVARHLNARFYRLPCDGPGCAPRSAL